MSGREPSASPLPLPPAYGKPTRPMAWSDADDLLTESRVYWIASVRPFGPSERTRPLQALPGGLVVDSPKALVAASSVSRRSRKRRSAPSSVSCLARR